MRLVNLNHSLECDWLIKLSDDKLSDIILASELAEKRSFFLTNHNQGIAIFMINSKI